MDWAIDRFGEVVAATDFIVYSAPFACPTCGEAVYHRRGTERRPHFAHYHVESGLICDAYFPGTGNVLSRSATGSGTGISKSAYDSVFDRDPNAGARLCIEYAERRDARLILRLPAAWVISPDASIVIESKMGRQQIRPREAGGRRFVRVPWSVPIGTCQVNQDDGRLEDEIRAALESLDYRGNFFTVSNDRGLLLGRGEDLELGRTYWLVTQQAPALSGLPRSVSAEQLEGPGIGWLKFRICLPLEEPSLSDAVRIEEALGRNIRAASHRARVIYPVPSRFASDGIGIYSADTDPLIIKWSGEGAASIERDGAGIEAEEASDSHLFKVGSAISGEYVVRASGAVVLAFRVEDTEPFRPRGVRVEDEVGSRELFELDQMPSSENGMPATLCVPVSRLWRVGRINGLRMKYVPEDVWNFTADVQEVDFGAFGVLAVPIRHEINDDSGSSSPVLESRSLNYIYGVAYRHGGAASARELLSLKGASDYSRWALKNQLQWLLPHLVPIVRKEKAK